MVEWLEAALGPSQPFPRLDLDRLHPPAPVALPEFGLEAETDPLVRLSHARGQGLPDLLRLRGGAVTRWPEAVVRPSSDAELAALLGSAEREGLHVVPRGGGTSVTGGVNVDPDAPPTVVANLERLAGLEALDEVSGLATFGAGTAGPQIEDELATHGLTLGHFPQSWELSTLGGWIVTRSAGQESLGHGRIEDLVAGLELVAPAGRLELAAQPASAAGPDLRQLVLGSEGRLGVVIRATVRVRPMPETPRVEAVLMPEWAAGVEAARELVREGVGLSLLRLSDAPETAVALRVGLAGHGWGGLARAFLRLKGLSERSCLLLLGASGERAAVDLAFERARTLLRPHGAAWLGARPGRRWLADRFRHPYLRDALLDRGYATDTFETAAPWSRLGELYRAVAESLEGEGSRVPLLCHLSHPYRDGASLYFTFFFPCPAEADAAIARWAELKRRATEALVSAGGTLSHHHGVGSWHAPWLGREIGETGLGVLEAAARRFDPRGVLNPGVLLGTGDRLEA